MHIVLIDVHKNSSTFLIINLLTKQFISRLLNSLG